MRNENQGGFASIRGKAKWPVPQKENSLELKSNSEKQKGRQDRGIEVQRAILEGEERKRGQIKDKKHGSLQKLNLKFKFC